MGGTLTPFQLGCLPGTHKLMLDPVRSAIEVRAHGIVAALPALGGTLRRRSSDTWVSAEMSLLLDPGNIEAGDPESNACLRSTSAFDVANHPHIRFKVRIVRRPASLQLEIHGTMEFKGHEVPLVMDVRCLGEREGARRLLARGVAIPCEGVVACRREGGREYTGPERVEVVVHSEWIETPDPVSAA